MHRTHLTKRNESNECNPMLYCKDGFLYAVLRFWLILQSVAHQWSELGRIISSIRHCIKQLKKTASADAVTAKNVDGKRTFTRGLWHMAEYRQLLAKRQIQTSCMPTGRKEMTVRNPFFGNEVENSDDMSFICRMFYKMQQVPSLQFSYSIMDKESRFIFLSLWSGSLRQVGQYWDLARTQGFDTCEISDIEAEQCMHDYTCTTQILIL